VGGGTRKVKQMPRLLLKLLVMLGLVYIVFIYAGYALLDQITFSFDDEQDLQGNGDKVIEDQFYTIE
jgi:hypothetical protein